MFYRNINLAMSINDAGDIRRDPRTRRDSLQPLRHHRDLSPPVGWHQSYGWAVSGDGTAAAGYSFLDSGTMQATRWSLPAPGR